MHHLPVDPQYFNPTAAVVPNVVERTSSGKEGYDIFTRLLMDRIIFLTGPINDMVSTAVCAQLLYLESQNPKKDIMLYINSPGGSVSAGLAMYDTMQLVKAPVNTFCVGLAASAGSLLLMAGTKGKRFALPHSRVMVHQPSAGYQGQVTDISIHAEEVIELKRRLNQIMADHTGQSLDKIEADLERDNFMSAEAAVEYGIIDTVLAQRKEMGDKSDD